VLTYWAALEKRPAASALRTLIRSSTADTHGSPKRLQHNSYFCEKKEEENHFFGIFQTTL